MDKAIRAIRLSLGPTLALPLAFAVTLTVAKKCVPTIAIHVDALGSIFTRGVRVVEAPWLAGLWVSPSLRTSPTRCGSLHSIAALGGPALTGGGSRAST